ncbi:DNA gyrase inhibitor YacG [Neptunicella sp. SCSIO 80796]|uniref:DNA gyrase inhibitor YacG n=1 Tax=Neptunicella plasticusilytica TaxID=3117012 RepID=UPI003A4E48B0
MQVKCPQCFKQVTWNSESPYRPFCSKRCQLIDLGEWADEQKAIPCGASKDAETASPEIDVEDIEAMLSQQNDDFFNQ